MCSLNYIFATIMAYNLERRMRKTFNERELVPNSVELVFSQEELARDREKINVFPFLDEHHLSLQRPTNILSRMVKQLFVWSRYIQRMWRYFLE